jgi:hypothetical protein
MKIEWSKISLFFLFVVALIGTLLRSFSYFSSSLEYSNLVHAHSHVAFQGWIYSILMLVLTTTFLNEYQIQKGIYKLQFKLTIFIVFIILITFSIQGYALFSIISSTLFQFLNYWFIIRFLKDTKYLKKKFYLSLKFIRTGLYFGVLSTFIPYVVGVVSAKGLNGSELYKSLIYIFLHLQYNGWFLFVILGLLFHFLKSNRIKINSHYVNLFYILMKLLVIPSIILSLLGMSYSKIIEIPSYFIAIFLLIAIYLFYKSINFKDLIYKIHSKKILFKLYFYTFLFSLLLKLLLQFFSVFRNGYIDIFNNKSLILGYLHLNFIGLISFFILAFLIEIRWLPYNRYSKIGLTLFFFGFILTEIILSFNSINFFNSQGILTLGSFIMLLGIGLLTFSRNNTTK